MLLFAYQSMLAQPPVNQGTQNHETVEPRNTSNLKLNYGLFDSVPFFHGTRELELSIAGGFNSPQFSQCDLNFDGLQDLVVFERNTQKVKTFINRGKTTGNTYKYAPQYQKFFPQDLQFMCVMRDYNNDGKADIFTIKSPGMAVYKNVSDSTQLKFEIVDYFPHSNVGIVDYITSDFFGNFTSNIYVLPGDIPAIEDIDGDGDLDILNFGVWGVTTEFHKNLSVELTGGTDTLAFEYVTGCWGEFIENSTSNTVTFGYKCKGNTASGSAPSGARHAGSNILAIDLDGDHDKDVVLGDIGYNNLVALYNSGDSTYAIMNTLDSTFPSNTTPVDLFIFPAGYYLDVDNNNTNELIASPNIGGAGLDLNNVWLYKNNGTNNSPSFEYVQNDFFVNQMVDVGTNAYPVFVDINADGLQDLIIGNYGNLEPGGKFVSSLSYYKNTGDSTIPVFTLVTNDLGTLKPQENLALYPSFGDMDNDNDLDMVLGDYNGKLTYYENTAGVGNDPVFAKATILGLDSIDVGLHATPQLVDLSGDGLLDILIGERNGTINFLPNKGTAAQAIYLKADLVENFGGISHTNDIGIGYTIPYAVQLDTVGRVYGKDLSGKWQLFVATETGNVFAYQNIEADLMGTFQIFDTLFTNTYRPSVCVAEVNGDSIADIVVGDYAGGLSFFFKGQGIQFPPPPIDTSDISVPEITQNNILLYPNPASTSVRIEFDELFSGGTIQLINLNGQVFFNEVIPANTNFAEFSVTNYASGQYFVLFQSSKNKVEKVPLIIKK